MLPFLFVEERVIGIDFLNSAGDCRGRFLWFGTVLEYAGHLLSIAQYDVAFGGQHSEVIPGGGSPVA